VANHRDAPERAHGALPIAPSEDAWRRLTPPERMAFLALANDALSDPARMMSEGRPHKKAKSRAVDLLGLHFSAIGRAIYVAEEMAVVYPGEEVFSPDVLAVLDVAQPEDDERMAWVVADEGRGIDLAFEVLHRGDRNKDLVENVARYARLGIPEYFVYDRARQRIHGYRLPVTGAGRYDRIVPQSGRFTSAVLGLDLAIQGGTLRFFHGMAELFGTDDLIGRLNRTVEALGAKADEAEARADEADARANEADARTEQALAGLRGAIVAAIEARGTPCPEDVKARVGSCADPATLQRWLLVVMKGGTEPDL
jgi:Uma2 family endonuclease